MSLSLSRSLASSDEAPGDLLDMGLRLRALSRTDGSFDAAQVRVIGLDEIKAAAGPRWPGMRERVRAGSLAILSQNGHPDDIIIPAGDGFLVILAQTAQGQIQTRCQKMRDALHAFYLGEEAMASLRPEVKGRALTADGFADLLCAQSRDTSDARAGQQAKTDAMPTADLLRASDATHIGKLLCPKVAEGDHLRVAYNSDFILDGHHVGADYAAMDFAILAAAAEALAATEPHPALGFTVHASTLQSRRSRDAYFAALGQHFNKRHGPAFITIAEIEKGTPLISIAEWAGGLRSVTAKVGLDFHYTDLAISSLGGAGAWAAGFHLPVHADAQSDARGRRTLENIQFWARSLHCQGMRLAVNGFRDAGFLAHAARHGVDIATGEGLNEPKPTFEAI